MSDSILDIATFKQNKRPLLVTSNREEPNHGPIWKQEGKVYSAGVVGLHEEIIDFVSYICPSPEEHWVREIVISKVRSVAHSLWRNCRVDVFGSFSTGLYLPTSDIDVVIFGKWPQLPLGTLERALRESEFGTDIKVLSKATVPIVKFTDSDTGLHVDISFDMVNSARAVRFVHSHLRVYPCLRYLVFTLKQFLLLRDLNEVWTGGISSYALILMCIAFLRQNVKENEAVNAKNLGTLLLGFFEFYGINFNYMTTGIKFSAKCSFVSQNFFVKNLEPGQCLPPLCIEDPLCPGNNVSRRSYSSPMVLQAFKNAYLTLSAALRADSKNTGSVLSAILHIPPATLESRKRVQTYVVQMCQLMPSFFVPRMMHHKFGILPLYLQQTSPKACAPKSSECRKDDLNRSNSMTKEPIVVSARGLSARPQAFWQLPNVADVLFLAPYWCLSTNPYDPLYFPVSSPPSGTPPVPESTVVALSHSAFASSLDPTLFPSYIPIQTEPESVDGDSTAMSRTVLDGISDRDEILAESELHKSPRAPDVTLSEDKEIYREPINRTYKSGRSASASHAYASLVNKLVPLRLSSSEQNFSRAGENRQLDSSYSLSSPSMLPSSTASSTNSKEPGNSERMEADAPEPPSLRARMGKSSRRRRRPFRKNGRVDSAASNTNAMVTAAETQALPVRSKGCYISSNEEAEESGCICQSVHQTKRKCSQLHSMTIYHETKRKEMVSTSQAVRGYAKAWSSCKPSARM